MKRIKFRENYEHNNYNSHRIDKRKTVIVENLGTHHKMDEVLVKYIYYFYYYFIFYLLFHKTFKQLLG